MPAATPPIERLALDRNDRPAETFRSAVVAIGSFDGVHRGHQALIGNAARLAARLGSHPVALTFEPHPRTVLQPDAPFFRLTQPPAKRVLLGIAGAAGVAEMRFDAALAKLTPEAFVESILVDRLAARGVVVGEGFRFGAKRAGDTELLARLGRRSGFSVDIASIAADDDGRPISSGRVRSALSAGDLADANASLGYRWFVTGTVVPGDRRGRELGYPTANLRLPGTIGLCHGIYAVTARWPGGALHPAVASYGIRPMFDGDSPLLEIHVFDFDGDLYGSDLTVFFHARLRGEERFPSTAALIRQMDVDSAESRTILADAGDGGAIDRALAAGIEQVAETRGIA